MLVVSSRSNQTNNRKFAFIVPPLLKKLQFAGIKYDASVASENYASARSKIIKQYTRDLQMRLIRKVDDGIFIEQSSSELSKIIRKDIWKLLSEVANININQIGNSWYCKYLGHKFIAVTKAGYQPDFSVFTAKTESGRLLLKSMFGENINMDQALINETSLELDENDIPLKICLYKQTTSETLSNALNKRILSICKILQASESTKVKIQKTVLALAENWSQSINNGANAFIKIKENEYYRTAIPLTSTQVAKVNTEVSPWQPSNDLSVVISSPELCYENHFGRRHVLIHTTPKLVGTYEGLEKVLINIFNPRTSHISSETSVNEEEVDMVFAGCPIKPSKKESKQKKAKKRALENILDMKRFSREEISEDKDSTDLDWFSSSEWSYIKKRAQKKQRSVNICSYQETQNELGLSIAGIPPFGSFLDKQNNSTEVMHVPTVIDADLVDNGAIYFLVSDSWIKLPQMAWTNTKSILVPKLSLTDT